MNKENLLIKNRLKVKLKKYNNYIKMIINFYK